MNHYYVYIITNHNNTTLYIGVTNDIQRRMYEHRNGIADGFTKKYCIDKLVYWEECGDVSSAIAREKQLKNWHRPWKINLIREFNPEWKDLRLEG